jgi:acyl-CoA synthetase (NDP forming)
VTVSGTLRSPPANDAADAVLTLVWGGESALADDVVALYAATTKPVVPVVTIGPQLLAERGLPTFADPTRAVRALGSVARVSERPFAVVQRHEVDAVRADRARSILSAVAGRPFILESSAKELLSVYGIPVARESVCLGEDAAVKAAQALPGKIVVKALSYNLPHKSDSGGLVLGLSTSDEVRAAYRAVSALASDTVTIDSVLVQEMVSSRLELALGLQRDPVPLLVTDTGLCAVDALLVTRKN